MFTIDSGIQFDVMIDSAVPFKPQAPKPGVKAKRGAVIPPSVANATNRYAAAYEAVYGIPPHIEWDGTYIRITGQPQGVTVQRLKEMTLQLKYRTG